MVMIPQPRCDLFCKKTCNQVIGLLNGAFNFNSNNDFLLLGHDAAFPTTSASSLAVPLTGVNIDEEEPLIVTLSLQHGDEMKYKKSKRKITQYDVLEEQYKALILKRENLALKKRKLELEVFLLEQKVIAEDSTTHASSDTTFIPV